MVTVYHTSDYVRKVARCSRCNEHSIWANEGIVFPKTTTAPQPHDEMPNDVRRDFEEARLVVDDSPRSAAALLRLAIQRLLDNHLEVEDDRIYDQIGTLVEQRRISPRVQRALDSVRVVGSNSVHPGEMDMDDNRDTALALFKLVNVIVDETIGRDDRIDEFYDTLPEGPREGIENRDS